MLAVALAGCGADFVQSRPSRTPPLSARAVADWDDLDAAVEVAAAKAELAVVSRRDERDGSARVELVSATDEPALLVARPAHGYSPGPRPILIDLSLGVGRFGDSTRERIFLDAVKSRLEQLAGVDWAPLKP